MSSEIESGRQNRNKSKGGDEGEERREAAKETLSLSDWKWKHMCVLTEHSTGACAMKRECEREGDGKEREHEIQRKARFARFVSETGRRRIFSSFFHGCRRQISDAALP